MEITPEMIGKFVLEEGPANSRKMAMKLNVFAKMATAVCYVGMETIRRTFSKAELVWL